MTDAPAIPAARSRAPWPLSLIVGGALTAIVVVTAMIAFVWTPYDVEAVNIAAKLTAPQPPIRSARTISVATSCR